MNKLWWIPIFIVCIIIAWLFGPAILTFFGDSLAQFTNLAQPILTQIAEVLTQNPIAQAITQNPLYTTVLGVLGSGSTYLLLNGRRNMANVKAEAIQTKDTLLGHVSLLSQENTRQTTEIKNLQSNLDLMTQQKQALEPQIQTLKQNLEQTRSECEQLRGRYQELQSVVDKKYFQKPQPVIQ